MSLEEKHVVLRLKKTNVAFVHYLKNSTTLFNFKEKRCVVCKVEKYIYFIFLFLIIISFFFEGKKKAYRLCDLQVAEM